MWCFFSVVVFLVRALLVLFEAHQTNTSKIDAWPTARIPILHTLYPFSAFSPTTTLWCFTARFSLSPPLHRDEEIRSLGKHFLSDIRRTFRWCIFMAREKWTLERYFFIILFSGRSQRENATKLTANAFLFEIDSQKILLLIIIISLCLSILVMF